MQGWGELYRGRVGGSCKDGWSGMGHAGVRWVGWVMQGWGRSCRGWVVHTGVGHAGVGWVMQGWGGSFRGGVGWVIQGAVWWVM